MWRDQCCSVGRGECLYGVFSNHNVESSQLTKPFVCINHMFNSTEQFRFTNGTEISELVALYENKNPPSCPEVIISHQSFCPNLSDIIIKSCQNWTCKVSLCVDGLTLILLFLFPSHSPCGWGLPWEWVLLLSQYLLESVSCCGVGDSAGSGWSSGCSHC